MKKVFNYDEYVIFEKLGFESMDKLVKYVESNKSRDEKNESFKLFESIENLGRLSTSLTDILNIQIKNELQSSHIYLGMSCWLDGKGWIGARKYFFKSGIEELEHMKKIYQYLFDRNVLAVVPTVNAVQQEFGDIREILNLSLEHEIAVTKNWDNIAEMAKAEGDNTTYEFAQWFLKEQIEEEDKFRDILFKLNLDMPKWKIDELFEDLMG